MLLPNNSRIEVSALNAKLKSIADHGRRKTPLSIGQNSPAAKQAINDALGLYATDFQNQSSSNWRIFVKQIPVVGPLLTLIYQRTRQIAAPGLSWKQRFRLIPLLGAFSLWVKALAIGHSTRHQLHYLEVTTKRALAEIHSQLDSLAALSTTNDIQQNNRVAAIKRELARISQGHTVKPFAVGSSMPSQTTSSTKARNVNTDSFYIDFEDTFRGTREDISRRLQVYLPYLVPFANDAAAHMVDVGCGRGEWLSLLKQHGYNATGIDLNPVMIDACRAHGLQAECADAIDYLSQQPEGSLALVTGFHIIEHLPFETLLALFDAALRALRPDGLIIFETPNPENLKVGACNFYTDPTHLNPIVPEVAQFIARQRGFANAKLLRLHPYPESHMLVEDSELAKRFNAAFYGPQDYSVVAWKTHAI